MPTGLLLAIISANLKTSALTSLTILLTNPNYKASYAEKNLPVNNNSLNKEELAFYCPSLYKVPISGDIPISISLIENFASSEQYLISPEVIKSIPPPRQ